MNHVADALGALQQALPLSEKISVLHRTIRARFPFVERVAVALFDGQQERIRTFVSSNHENGLAAPSPIQNYEVSLDEAPALKEVLLRGTPRVVNDLSVYAKGEREHTRRIANEGFRSSYTVPVTIDRGLKGIVFFNARRTHCFGREVTLQLDVFAMLIAKQVLQDLMSLKAVRAATHMMSRAVRHRDHETGAHMDRLGLYARIIALHLSRTHVHPLDDEYIECLQLYSALHDVGKIGIPDSILLSPNKLEPEELAQMREHTTNGRRILESFAESFGLGGISQFEMLTNIVEFHHEKMDGSGYPKKLKGEAIPLEARIVAVADVYDALTNRRPYKTAWSHEQAADELRRMAQTELDPDCVEALLDHPREVLQVTRCFGEPPLERVQASELVDTTGLPPSP